MPDTGNAHLLSILDAHGQSFLSSFAALDSTNTRKRKNDQDEGPVTKRPRETKEFQEVEEEWHGINKDSLSIDSSSDDDDDEGEESGDAFEHTDDELTAGSIANNVVVFSDVVLKKGAVVDHVAKAQMKAFMSSKISKLSASNSQDLSKAKKTLAEEEEDRTNAQNDALLHKLVHTKLLTGSLETELDLTPAKRRKALAGRVLELTGDAKLGKGEKLVRDAERNKAAKRIREGIAHKQKERGKQELEEAKNLGNYHPKLKKVYEASSSTPVSRKREKGLKMGVGKFINGSLRLSRDDVNMAMGAQGGLSGRGGSRGGRGQSRKRK